MAKKAVLKKNTHINVQVIYKLNDNSYY